MSDDSQRNSAVNSAATTNIHHVNLQDLPLSTARRLYKGGVRPGEPIRTRIQAQEMLDKIPHPAPEEPINPVSPYGSLILLI